MFWRWIVLVGLAVVLAPLTASAVDVHGSPLTDTEFQDWSGILNETKLKDRSVLSEYIARTLSPDTQDAVLEIAFVPRFGCSPSVRVIVPEQDSQSTSGQGLIWFFIDGQLFDFPALIDSDSTVREYSFLAEHSRQQELRLLMDRSSQLLVLRTETADDQPVPTNPRAAQPVRFSLLGSRMSMAAVESRCQTHAPLPFELSNSK